METIESIRAITEVLRLILSDIRVSAVEQHEGFLKIYNRAYQHASARGLVVLSEVTASIVHQAALHLENVDDALDRIKHLEDAITAAIEDKSGQGDENGHQKATTE